MSPVPAARVRRLELEQFRTYESVTLDIPAMGLRIAGRNGSGKTSLVESLLLISTTRSRPAAQDADLIGWESGVDLGVAPYTRVVADIERDDAQARIEVFIQAHRTRGTTKKTLKVSDRPRRVADVVGLLPTVTFSPEDLDLVLGSPSVRRRWLDVMLSQSDRKYLRFLSRYTRILSQRNGLLKQMEGAPGNRRGEFDYWDEQLSALGSYVLAVRAIAIDSISRRAGEHFGRLAPEVAALGMEYISTLEQPDEWWRAVAASASPDEAMQRVGRIYERRLKESFTADASRGVTQIGPHRDDVQFTTGGRPLARFGSRGQQRLAIVALKLAEADYMTEVAGVRPLFMLDDVLSELDPIHRGTLLETIVLDGGQLLVTATEDELLQHACLEHLAMARIPDPGRIEIVAG